MLNYYRYSLKSIRRIKKKKNLMNCNRKLMKKRSVGNIKETSGIGNCMQITRKEGVYFFLYLHKLPSFPIASFLPVKPSS